MLNHKSVGGNAVVIGAGTMGGGIAALLANAGWDVRMLDVASPGAETGPGRNQAAQAGLERLRQNKPPLLFLPDFADRIRIGNVEDDLDALGHADWIVEAVAERMDVKHSVMETVEAHAGPATVISTNTSGLSLAEIASDRGAGFKARFLGTHFFNPPRYVKLLELIQLPDTDPEVAQGFAAFAERVLGRRVVRAKDTPGFISNRVGMFNLVDTIHTAIEQELTVEEVDYLTGPLIGRPRSATFRLADIIGFDIIADVARNQYERSTADPRRDRLVLPTALQRLVADGRLGEKTGAGFYKREGNEILALDLESLDYRPRIEVRIDDVEALSRMPLPQRFREIALNRAEPWGRFLYDTLAATDSYVRSIAPDIADDVLSIDRVMMWGFNWAMGPFEIGDILRGPDASHVHYSGSGAGRKYRVFGRDEMQPLPDEPDYISLSALKAEGRAVRESDGASLLDLGAGVACLEFHSKMNVLDPAMTAFVNLAREAAERDFVALVIGNQGPHFSAGYNLTVFLEAIAAADWPAIERNLQELQDAYMRLKYCRVPVVACPHGYTLGGGSECVLHCSAVQAAAELQMGLPEATVGILPAGGGTKEMLARAMADCRPDSGAFPAVERVFELIATGRLSGNAFEAQRMGFLRSSDGISMNSDRRLWEAKQRALGMANAGYRPPVKKGVWVLGEEGLAQLRMRLHWRHSAGVITDHDRLVGDRVAYVLCGGSLPYAQEVSEDELLGLEREAFIALAHEPKSADRMRHTLETGKPLKN